MLNIYQLYRKKTSNDTIDDYLAFMQECAKLDANHASYMLKADFSIGLVSGDLLRRPFEEGAIAQILGADGALDKLLQLFNDRCNNNFNKKKHTFCVLARSAIRRFIHTGKMSDHFWALRSFTPEERLKILHGILDNLRKNKYLHYFFLREEECIGSKEIDLYEGKGLLIQNASTDYRLVGSHSEIMITHPAVMECFRDYFLLELIPTRCYRESDSMRIFASLVNECELMVAGNARQP